MSFSPRPFPSLFLLLLVFLPSLTNGRTYKNRFYFDVYADNTAGNLIDVQQRSFLYTEDGTLQATLECDIPDLQHYWSSGPTFNIFLCDETPRTNWLYLYPLWGMCFSREHPYHHCTIAPLTQNTANTWTFNSSVTKGTGLVARIRSCPIYSGTFSAEPTVSVAEISCLYTGIMMNGAEERLSGDELWNPLLFLCLTVVYGLFVLKALYELVRYWGYFVHCSFYVYTLLVCKFSYVLCALCYYNFILTSGDVWKGYQDWEFLLAITLSAKFAAYYLTLFMVASGYCIYNSKCIFDGGTVMVVATLIFTAFFYLFITNDSYVEVPMVVILSAAYAAILALFWAFHFKRLLLIRDEFYAVEDRANHPITRHQINMKETLVGVAFGQIIAFLIFIIVFEFYHAENYPIPGSVGVVVVESIDFLIIAPLTLFFNTRDLSRFYPTLPPPPVIHVIKTPGSDLKISMAPASTTENLSDKFGDDPDHIELLPALVHSMDWDFSENFTESEETDDEEF